MKSGRYPIYQLQLSQDSLSLCQKIINSKGACSIVTKRCRVLIGLSNYSYSNLNYSQIARAHGISINFVAHVAKIYSEKGIDGILSIARSPNSNMARLKMDTRAESFLITLACTPPPFPYQRWTIELCCKELNRLMDSKNLTGNFSKSTVWRALKRNKLQPHRSEYWCIPHITPQFIMRMEKVLHIYSLPHDENFPVVCMD